ncbi:hypothetical protein FraQA3DRAFT_6467 [Frankia sp. QA3]|nr:hypothetical protein FraQA3DRAFT_6467 [Frankia sp. QA3]
MTCPRSFDPGPTAFPERVTTIAGPARVGPPATERHTGRPRLPATGDHTPRELRLRPRDRVGVSPDPTRQGETARRLPSVRAPPVHPGGGATIGRTRCAAVPPVPPPHGGTVAAAPPTRAAGRPCGPAPAPRPIRAARTGAITAAGIGTQEPPAQPTPPARAGTRRENAARAGPGRSGRDRRAPARPWCHEPHLGGLRRHAPRPTGTIVTLSDHDGRHRRAKPPPAAMPIRPAPVLAPSCRHRHALPNGTTSSTSGPQTLVSRR